MTTIIDGTLGITTAAATIIGALSAATETFTATPAVTTAQSMVQLNTANGYGSSNTVYRRFTNVVVNQGSDITYADSATLGATFTINTSGVYSISYSDQFSATTNYMAVVYGLGNASTSGLTAAPLFLSASNVLVAGSATTASAPANIGTTVYLAAGACIRVNANALASGTTTNLCQFTITRVA